MQRDDLAVERPVLHALDAPAEAEAQEGDVLRRVVPAVDADQRGRLEAVRGLLEHLAPAGRHQRLARIEVAGRLVQHQPALDPSSTRRKRPLRSMTAATVVEGFQTSALRAQAFLVFFRMKSAMRATPCLDRLLGGRVREADVLAFARHARAEMDVGEHRDAGLVAAGACELLGIAAPIMRQASVTFGHT